MRRFVLLSLAIFLVAGCSQPRLDETACELSAEEINGDWDVALYFDKDAEPSATEMILKLEQDGSLAGSFYGSPFEDVQSGEFRGKFIFTAVTSDGTGEYIHSAEIGCEAGFQGQTFSRGRDFLMPWIATRRVEAIDEQ